MQGVKRDMVAYPGCHSLRSLALGWLQTLLCRVWLGFQPVINQYELLLRRGGSRLHLRGRTALQAEFLPPSLPLLVSSSFSLFVF